MDESKSRKKPQGRPALSPLEKQRRLVARLHENTMELEHKIEGLSGYSTEEDELQRHLLLSTFMQRMSFARQAAKFEHDGKNDEAKAVRQKLNLFRPLGMTEEVWNALPDSERKLAPGKPKMPKELELARIEIERDDELQKLRQMEAEAGEEQTHIETLRARFGKTAVGRPGKDMFGTLDKQMHIAIYKRRDLDPDREQKESGRPQKSYEERYAYFTSIIDHCRTEIEKGESTLDLVQLQQRYVKRLRDKATRLRIQINNKNSPQLVTLKLDLAVIEDQIKLETGLLSDFKATQADLSDSQLQSRRTAVAKKIQAFDSLEFTADH
ncbi:hypothetical protein [Ectopseudomonas khazarica]|uniref:hypothetical protein n=1 Tax=Ectopseudomonas khazarica TaxID=2502979 RepID=UPI003B93BB3F